MPLQDRYSTSGRVEVSELRPTALGDASPGIDARLAK